MTCPICKHPGSKDAETCGFKYRHPKPSPPALGSAIELRMRYNIETLARFSACQVELKSARHFEKRSEPEKAIEFLDRLICEAKKLRLHLEAWEHYKPNF